LFQLATAQMGRINYCVIKMTWTADKVEVAVSEFIITIFFCGAAAQRGPEPPPSWGF